MALLLGRLAWRNLRYRPVAALLLLVALSTVTITTSVALAVHAAAQAPWNRTFDSTHGAHILANSEDPALLSGLLHAPGVVGAVGPYPLVPTTGTMGGYTLPLAVVGRDTLITPIDRPLLTTGSADLTGDTIVVEQSVADAVRAGIGDHLTINGVTLTVGGVALDVAQPPFPRYEPGQAWTSTTTARRLVGGATPRVEQIELVLGRPVDAPGFAAAHSNPRIYLTTWQQTRAAALQDIATIRVILLTVTVLLLLLTVSAVTVLVTTRMGERSRQIGILKALGVTPAQLTASLLVELGLIGCLAAAVGVVTGTRLAAVVGRTTSGVLAAPSSPMLSLDAVGLVVGVVAAILAIAAGRPALNATRGSTIHNLTAGTHQPASSSRLARLTFALKLPLPVELGARSMFRRPSRTALAIASLAISVALAAAALATQRTLQLQTAITAKADGPSTALQTVADHAAAHRIGILVYLFTVIFAVIGAVNLVFVASFAARDTATKHSILRTIGFTPAQTTASLITTQAAAGITGSVIGIPLGLLLFRAVYAATNSSSVPVANPPVGWLIGLAVLAALADVVVASGPALLISRRPVTTALTTD